MKLEKQALLVMKLALVALIGVGAGCSTVIEHPEFAQRRAAIRQIAVVSPTVEFHCQAPRSSQKLPDAEDKLHAELIAAVTRELTEKGFAVCFPTWETLATNDNLENSKGPPFKRDAAR